MKINIIVLTIIVIIIEGTESLGGIESGYVDLTIGSGMFSERRAGK